VETLRRAGVNLAIGTDGCASNNDLDMFDEMRSAALLAKGVCGDATAMDAAAPLHAATMGGARALGLAERIGSLEPGKQADLVCVAMDALETQPMYHAISQLVYATGRHRSPTSGSPAGRKLADGALVDMDADAIACARRNGAHASPPCVRAPEPWRTQAPPCRRQRRAADAAGASPRNASQAELDSSARSRVAGGIRRARSARCMNSIPRAWATSLDRVALRGARVLDVGCGAGLLSEAMAREGARRHRARPRARNWSKWRSCTCSNRACAWTTGCSRWRIAAADAGALRRDHLHGNARARARSGPRCCAPARRCSSRAACCSCPRSTARRWRSPPRSSAPSTSPAVAQGHARLRQLHPPGRTRRLAARRRPGAGGRERPGLRPDRRRRASVAGPVNYLACARK
jgi:hypothetical protein